MSVRAMREFSGNTVALPGVDPEWFAESCDAGYWDRWCRIVGFAEEGIWGYYASAYTAGWNYAEMDHARLQLSPEARAEELLEMRLSPREYSAHLARRVREREAIELAARIAAAAEVAAGAAEDFSLSN